jgi:O-methyltransferase domain
LKLLGYISSKCLCAANELNIPDILEDKPRTLPEIAAASDARQDRLRQVMRVLHNNGIFSYNASSDTYSNNTTSQMLTSSHWTQWRNWVDFYGNEFYDMARGIPASCKKDATRMPAQISLDTDTDMFTYFTEQGWLPRLQKTLGGGAIAQAPGILEDYPWEEIDGTKFLDVGGGEGGLVALVLRKHKNMHAGILDLPKVIEHASASFHTPGGKYADVADRVSRSNLLAGDFLVMVPSFEVYTMKWCLHDWDDSKALIVLRNIREAIRRGPKSRLVIFESLLSEGRMGRLSRYGDLTMMVSANGQERTVSQWNDLAKETGWKLKEIYPLRNVWPCAIEFVPVWDSKTRTREANLQPDLTGVTQRVPNGVHPALHPAETTQAVPTIKNGHVAPQEQPKINDSHSAAGVSSVMSFLEPWDSIRGEPFFRSAADEGFEQMNFKWVDNPVAILDARPNKQEFSLDGNGFTYVSDEGTMTSELLEALRTGEKETVQSLYYPTVEALMKQHTGASRIIIFDHTVRKRDPRMDSKDNPNGKEQPATVVSISFTHTFQGRTWIDGRTGTLRSVSCPRRHTPSELTMARSGKGAIRRLKQNIGEDEDVNAILKGRVQMIK